MLISRIIKSPLRRLKRYRVGRGFSVHSPFAFYFITRVLREPLPFYCFKSEITGRDERCLFRVVNYFRPATVALIGSDADTSRARSVILKACPAATFTAVPSPAADFTYATPGAPLPADFKVLYAAGPVAAPPRPAMTFTNGRTLIAVRRPSLPSQAFTLSF